MKTKPANSSYKLRCKICGERFKATSDDISLFEEGYCELPSVCEFCFNTTTNEQEPYSFTDADSGL